MDNQFRFGVFLRPDPKTCAAVTQITSQLRAQYGLVSAGAFPPHITLAGSLPVVVPLAELIQLIGFVLRRMAEGLSFEELQARTGAQLRRAGD